MSISPEAAAYHRHEAEVASEIYVAELTTGVAAADWDLANLKGRRDIIDALRASNCLRDISAAIQADGAHVRVFRHLLAPPISQDQFSLLCPPYSKNAENTGNPVNKTNADAVASAIYGARNCRLGRWLERGGHARPVEIRELLHAVAPMLSQQIIATVRRNRLSALQEGAVIALLEKRGWAQLNSGVVQTLADVPAMHFMHKTRFATKTQPQEVDVACGLGKTVVLAMECKVTNDKTNSVKRINDVLKKATAWQEHWGSFVRTAALLQGVIGYKDVERLLAANVEVFWSHKLDDFEAWIAANAGA